VKARGATRRPWSDYTWTVMLTSLAVVTLAAGVTALRGPRGQDPLDASPSVGVAVPQEQGKTTLKISLPADLSTYYAPSGWMGDGEAGTNYVNVDSVTVDVRGAQRVAIKLSYRPGPKGWAGVYWQHPDSNWGTQRGRDLSGAKSITFLAKGERGGEIVEFKAGGIRGKTYEDSFEVSVGRKVLSTSWEPFTIDLSDQNLTSVIGAFAWVAPAGAGKSPIVTYVFDLKIQ